MPQYPVLQPDGNFCLWSPVVDHFVRLNLTESECREALHRRYPEATAEEIENAMRRAADEPIMTWPQAVAWATYRHGRDATVTLAMQMTPLNFAPIAGAILADIRREAEMDTRE